jgi:hypothetical protein
MRRILLAVLAGLITPPVARAFLGRFADLP